MVLRWLAEVDGVMSEVATGTQFNSLQTKIELNYLI